MILLLMIFNKFCRSGENSLEKRINLFKRLILFIDFKKLAERKIGGIIKKEEEILLNHL